MKTKIVDREKRIMYEIEAGNLKEAIEKLVKENADLYNADLYNADLRNANLRNADLYNADLYNADLYNADLRNADLYNADLRNANLRNANLRNADLRNANLRNADLRNANLENADLYNADLRNANLRNADLENADLENAKNMIKIMGVEPGNIYWKRFNEGLKNNDFQFHVGINTLHKGEIFASDERILCSFPGFHFASRSWCAVNYPNRPLEAKIRIPVDAKINEPWATDGKASADKIEILQVFDTKTGEDVTEKYKIKRSKKDENKKENTKAGIKKK
jgi:hypothetical protein